MSQCAAGLSQHPEPRVAIGEVIGDLLARIGPHPDVAVLFVSGRMIGSISEIVATIHALLAPGVLIGAGAPAVIGSSDARPARDAIVVWAANTGDGPPPRPLRIDHTDGVSEAACGTTLLFGEVDDTVGTGTVVGAGGACGSSGEQVLVLDRSEYTAGGVGLVFAPETASAIEYTLPKFDELAPEGPAEPVFFNPQGGNGLLLFAEELTVEVLGSRFDFEIVLQGFHGSLAGTVVSASRPFAREPAEVAAGTGRRLSGLILH